MKKRSPLKPLGVRAQEELLRLFDSARRAAKLDTADFGKIGSTGPFPTQERQVTKFIRERTRLYRESWIITPLQQAIELIQNKRAKSTYLRGKLMPEQYRIESVEEPPRYWGPNGWSDNADESFAYSEDERQSDLERGEFRPKGGVWVLLDSYRPGRCICHSGSGSVCGSACEQGRCHDGCYAKLKPETPPEPNPYIKNGLCVICSGNGNNCCATQRSIAAQRSAEPKTCSDCWEQVDPPFDVKLCSRHARVDKLFDALVKIMGGYREPVSAEIARAALAEKE